MGAIAPIPQTVSPRAWGGVSILLLVMTSRRSARARVERGYHFEMIMPLCRVSPCARGGRGFKSEDSSQFARRMRLTGLLWRNSHCSPDSKAIETIPG